MFTGVNENGPLPLSVQNLDAIPEARKQQYQRQMDGTFALQWISGEDFTTHMSAYLGPVGQGLRVVEKGKTPIAVEDGMTEQEKNNAAAFNAELAKLEQERIDKRRAELEQAKADLQKKIEELDA